MSTLSLDDELRKKQLGLENNPYDRYAQLGINNPSVGEQSEVDKLLQNKGLFDITIEDYNAAIGSSYNNSGAAAGSSISSSIVDNRSNSFILENAILNNPINPTVDAGGTNAINGVQTGTSSAIQQSSGLGYNQPQDGATHGKNGIDTENRPGYSQVIENLSGTPSNPLDALLGPPPNKEPETPPETGEAMLTTETPEKTEKPAGEGTIGAESPEETNAKDNEIKTEQPKEKETPEANKPPETESEIDAEAEKKAAEEAQRKAQEEALRRIAEEEKK